MPIPKPTTSLPIPNATVEGTTERQEPRIMIRSIKRNARLRPCLSHIELMILAPNRAPTGMLVLKRFEYRVFSLSVQDKEYETFSKQGFNTPRLKPNI